MWYEVLDLNRILLIPTFSKIDIGNFCQLASPTIQRKELAKPLSAAVIELKNEPAHCGFTINAAMSTCMWWLLWYLLPWDWCAYVGFSKTAFQPTSSRLAAKIKRVIAELSSLYLHCKSSLFNLARLRLKLWRHYADWLWPDCNRNVHNLTDLLFQGKYHRCILLFHRRRLSIGTSCEIPRLRECGGTSTNLLKFSNHRPYSGHGSEKEAWVDPICWDITTEFVLTLARRTARVEQ